MDLIFLYNLSMDQISKDVEGAYDNIASDYKATVKSDDVDHRFIEKFISLFKPGQKILDIGAGTGTISSHMQHDHQLEVIAIDLSQEMVNLAKSEHPDLKILLMDLHSLQFPDAAFDGVFANYVLIHVEEKDVPPALKEVARTLKSGGYLYLALQEPITPMDKDGYYSVVYKPEVKMFLNLFTEQEMEDHLSGAGFAVTNIERRPPVVGMEFPFNKLFITAQKL